MTEISKEIKIELIKSAIKTDAGWKALAISIKNNEDKTNCIELLKEIGGDIQMYNYKLSDKLIETLEMYMEKV